MNITGYWKSKIESIKNDTKELTENERLARKLVLSEMMNIPKDKLAYCSKTYKWCRDFVGEDPVEEDWFEGETEEVRARAQEILEEYFYKKDYETLCGIRDKVEAERIICKIVRDRKSAHQIDRKTDQTEKKAGKSDVCNLIKELVSNRTYKKVDEKSKPSLDLLEKIYFEPIGLFNDYVEVAPEAYCDTLLEQWKVANEMAANISAQRNSMNNFNMSLMTMLIGSILISNNLTTFDAVTKLILYSVTCVVGVGCGLTWIAQIDNYCRLNGVKYTVINDIERKLPANVMLYEYMVTEKTARKNKAKTPFSEHEKRIAKLFLVAVASVSGYMIYRQFVELNWVEIICKFISDLMS